MARWVSAYAAYNLRRDKTNSDRPCQSLVSDDIKQYHAGVTDCDTTDQIDPSFLEFARREQTDQPELPWEA